MLIKQPHTGSLISYSKYMAIIYGRIFSTEMCSSFSSERTRPLGIHCSGTVSSQRWVVQYGGGGCKTVQRGCPTPFLEACGPVGFHSDPNEAHLIQQLVQLPIRCARLVEMKTYRTFFSPGTELAAPLVLGCSRRGVCQCVERGTARRG